MKFIRNIIGKQRRSEDMAAERGYLSERIAAAQRKAAGYLNTKTKDWPASRFKVALVCFCLAAGGNSVYIVARAIIRGNGPPKKNTLYSRPSRIQSGHAMHLLNNSKNQNNDNKTNR